MSAGLDYLAVDECGCIRGWVSFDVVKIDPGHVADVVASWIRGGLDVQRVTTEESRTRPWHCPKHPKVKQEELELASRADATGHP